MNLVDEKWNHGSTLAEIEKTIREGVPNTLMQAQKENFTTEQIADLAKYAKLRFEEVSCRGSSNKPREYHQADRPSSSRFAVKPEGRSRRRGQSD